jgi:hypothetical protein
LRHAFRWPVCENRESGLVILALGYLSRRLGTAKCRESSTEHGGFSSQLIWPTPGYGSESSRAPTHGKAVCRREPRRSDCIPTCELTSLSFQSRLGNRRVYTSAHVQLFVSREVNYQRRIPNET